MTVEAIASIGAIESAAALGAAGPAATAAAPAPGFQTMFANGIEQVNATLARADGDMQKLAVGETPSLHEVMIHMEEARLSFQLLAQVRTKLLESYQEVMRMQV